MAGMATTTRFGAVRSALRRDLAGRRRVRRRPRTRGRAGSGCRTVRRPEKGLRTRFDGWCGPGRARGSLRGRRPTGVRSRPTPGRLQRRGARGIRGPVPSAVSPAGRGPGTGTRRAGTARASRATSPTIRRATVRRLGRQNWRGGVPRTPSPAPPVRSSRPAGTSGSASPPPCRSRRRRAWRRASPRCRRARCRG